MSASKPFRVAYYVWPFAPSQTGWRIVLPNEKMFCARFSSPGDALDWLAAHLRKVGAA